MKIYISGLYCGPNPSAGVGAARSLRLAKPAVPAHRGLPVAIPPFVFTIEQDWALHAFGRRHGWSIWLKGPYYDAVRVNSWPSFMSLRAAFQSTWKTDRLFLQAHVRGLE